MTASAERKRRHKSDPEMGVDGNLEFFIASCLSQSFHRLILCRPCKFVEKYLSPGNISLRLSLTSKNINMTVQTIEGVVVFGKIMRQPWRPWEKICLFYDQCNKVLHEKS